MLKSDVLTLIAESPQAHGVFDTYTPTERTVFCTIRSATYNDILVSGSEGLRPDLVFRIPHDFEYDDEKLCRYNGTLYEVDRTYTPADADWIELTCVRRGDNVR